jgi:hypothetical protein
MAIPRRSLPWIEGPDHEATRISRDQPSGRRLSLNASEDQTSSIAYELHGSGLMMS